MKQPTTTTYALLGLLGVQPWTGYELTQQATRSLRYGWPSSEANLYREQKLLVELGWATVESEAIGQRSRNRYRITPQGRKAMRAWLKTTPEPPRLEIEGVVRTFFADQAGPAELKQSLEATASGAREALAPLVEILGDYQKTSGPFPDRVHLIAMTADLVTDLLERIDTFAKQAAAEVEAWSTTKRPTDNKATSLRLKKILKRAETRN